MLSRVAESLYWMSRNLARAESLARIVDVAFNRTVDRNVAGRPADAKRRARAKWLYRIVEHDPVVVAGNGDEGTLRIGCWCDRDGSHGQSAGAGSDQRALFGAVLDPIGIPVDVSRAAKEEGEKREREPAFQCACKYPKIPRTRPIAVSPTPNHRGIRAPVSAAIDANAIEISKRVVAISSVSNDVKRASA